MTVEALKEEIGRLSDQERKQVRDGVSLMWHF
jgi:hypothetical protein